MHLSWQEGVRTHLLCMAYASELPYEILLAMAQYADIKHIAIHLTLTHSLWFSCDKSSSLLSMCKATLR